MNELAAERAVAQRRAAELLAAEAAKKAGRQSMRECEFGTTRRLMSFGQERPAHGMSYVWMIG